jgi:hypothetical protein
MPFRIIPESRSLWTGFLRRSTSAENLTGERHLFKRYKQIDGVPKCEALAAITLRPVIENSEVAPVKVPVAAQPGQIR